MAAAAAAGADLLNQDFNNISQLICNPEMISGNPGDDHWNCFKITEDKKSVLDADHVHDEIGVGPFTRPPIPCGEKI